MTAAQAPLTANAWLRWDVVSRQLPEGPVDILEVGCGQGAVGSRLAARSRSYVGLEPDVASFEVATERVVHGNVRNTVVEDLSDDEVFDVVCAFEVLEHLEDDAAALAEWVAHLRPGGTLLISVPAFQDRFGPADEMVGHFRRYDPPALRLLLRRAGLEQVEITLYGMPLGYALETARNTVGRIKARRSSNASMAERSGHSGRLLQPESAWQRAATELGTLPFRRLQRAFPRHGPGIVARGVKPRR